ncbi:MAG: hypothetical protein AAB451_03045 [Patescibacteria group bacterium]
MKGEIFHILNRGIEKREIFSSEKDYLRFIHNLFDFNSTQHAIPYPRRCNARDSGHAMSTNSANNEKLIDLLCWCLMPNHSHNLAQEVIDRGASVFSKKIFGGYTKYVNENYQRSGVLFQGRSKIIPIKKDSHFLRLPFYIMANPVKLIEPDWKEKGIRNLNKVIIFLENYRWSSLPYLIGKENSFPFVNKSLFYELFQTNEDKFKKDFIEWLKNYK